jgi:hypothetical protein
MGYGEDEEGLTRPMQTPHPNLTPTTPQIPTIPTGKRDCEELRLWATDGASWRQ